jgi:hypothetical protein
MLSGSRTNGFVPYALTAMNKALMSFKLVRRETKQVTA